MQAHPSYGEMQSWLSTRNPESSTPGLLQSSPKKTNPIECSPETGHSGGGGCLDHVSSPKQSPLLLGTERIMTTDQSSQPMLKSAEVENICQSLLDIKFGIFESASSPIGKDSPAGEPADSRSSMPPTIEKQKQEKLCERDEER